MDHKPTSLGSEEEFEEFEEDFEDALENETSSQAQTALDAVVATFNIGLEQLRQPQSSGNSVGVSSGVPIIRRPSGIIPPSSSSTTSSLSRQRPIPIPRQQLQHASPSRAEYRKLAPPRHSSQASKQRPKPPSLPPPQNFARSTEGSSFVGGAHLPMAMFIGTGGNNTIASRSVPENVFDLFDADKQTLQSNSRQGDLSTVSNVFDMFNEPIKNEGVGMTSMTLSDFLQNDHVVATATVETSRSHSGKGVENLQSASLSDFLPANEPSYSQRSAPPSPPALAVNTLATSPPMLRTSAPSRSSATARPTVLLPSQKSVTAVATATASAHMSSTPPAGEHDSLNEHQHSSGVRDGGFEPDPFAGIESASVSTTIPSSSLTSIHIIQAKPSSTSPSPAASRSSVESLNVSVSTATSTHKSSVSNTFHLPSDSTDNPPSIISTQSKVLEHHTASASSSTQNFVIPKIHPVQAIDISQNNVEDGCFGFLSDSVSAVREVFGFVPPLRAPGYVTVGSSQRDYIEFSSLALCQRLEHTSAAFVRLAQARQALVADRLYQLQFQRQQRFAAAEASAEKINISGGVSDVSGGGGGGGGDASVGSDSGVGLGERRLSDSSMSSSLEEGSQVTSPHVGPSSDLGGSAPRGTAASKSYYTGSVDDHSIESVSGKGGHDRRVASRLPPLTEEEASAEEEYVKSSIPALPPRAPLETIWTMKFSPDGKYLAAAGGTDQGAVIRVWKVRPWKGSINVSDGLESLGSAVPLDAGSDSRRESKSDTVVGAAAVAVGGIGRARSSSSNSRSSTSSHNTDVSGSTGAGTVSIATIEKEMSAKSQQATVASSTTTGGAAAAAAAALAQLDLYSKKAGVGSQQSTVVVGPAAEIPSQRSAQPPITHTLTSPTLAAARITGGNLKRISKKRVPHVPSVSVPSTARGPSQVTSVALITHGQPFFENEPVQEWLGHESHVVDISWSRSNLLLSASMDGWVRLWHISQADCLHKFQHPDCVTSVAFSPSIGSRDSSMFITGCFDKKLRLWSLETGRVTAWQAAPAMITAAAFSPSGHIVIAGLFNGMCVIYSADGLVSLGNVDCRNRRGPFRHGRKVTGIDFTSNSSHALVTTNDSRIRLIDLLSKQTVAKFSGLRNQNLQVRATLDTSSKRLVAGSEDGRVIIWRTQNDLFQPAINPRMTGYDSSRVRSFEYFIPDEGGQSQESENALRAEELAELGTLMRPAVTVALFAPQEALDIARPVSFASKWCAKRGLQATAALAVGRGGVGNVQPQDDQLAMSTGHGAGTGVGVGVLERDEKVGKIRMDQTTYSVGVGSKGLSSISNVPPDAAVLALELQRAREAVGLEERLATHGVLICADSRGVLRVYENVGEKFRL
jgi:WD40 repeat protein